jgi:hypothetical protein
MGFWSVLLLPLLGASWFIIIWVRRAGVAMQTSRGLGGLKSAQTYALCHDLLNAAVKQAYYILPKLDPLNAEPVVQWRTNTVSAAGLIIPPADSTSQAILAPIPWDEVSGVGVEMAPVFAYSASTRSYWDVSTRVTLGYRFTLLMVLTNGSTLSLEMPLQENRQALAFTALVLACARFHQRKMTLVGFDKDLTASVVHKSMF